MNEIEEIKDRINIVDFISNYIQLQKAGSNYRGICPFHQEKTPSFMVSPEKQFYNCFGCSEHGDIFDFLQKIENLSFPEALEILADKAGVILPKYSKKTPQQIKLEKNTKNLSYKINKISTLIFHKYLTQSRHALKAKKYLQIRKINSKTIDQFLIGFAPCENILKNYFFKKNISISDLKSAGNPQIFFDRIMFPIFDILGNTVGFTGRTINKDLEPKYLNTPETIIFHKSKIIYGLNFAKEEIKKQNNAIMVEGQMDVVLSHQANIKNTIASSGTALTSDQLKILSRITSNISFCFDNDSAGFNATTKAIKLSFSQNLTPYVIELPKDYKDVGELVEKNPQKWKKVSQQKTPAFDWIIKKTFDKYHDLTTNNKKNITKELVSYLVLLSDPIELKHYKKIISQKLIISEKIIDEIILRYKKTNQFKKPQIDKFKKTKLSVYEMLLGLVLTYPKYIYLITENISLDEFKDDDSKSIYKVILSCYNKNKSKPDIEKISKCIQSKLTSDLDKKVKFLIINIESKEKKSSDIEIKQEILDYIAKIKFIKNSDIKNRYAHLISEAENKKDIKTLKKLLKEFQNQIKK